jgi:hypothetical protein
MWHFGFNMALVPIKFCVSVQIKGMLGLRLLVFHSHCRDRILERADKSRQRIGNQMYEGCNDAMAVSRQSSSVVCKASCKSHLAPGREESRLKAHCLLVDLSSCRKLRHQRNLHSVHVLAVRASSYLSAT